MCCPGLDPRRHFETGWGAEFGDESRRALAQVNQDLVQELGRRCADQKIATIDLDGTIIESWKREAQATYQGGAVAKPMLALWVEMNVVMADEFRDGNVPALQAPAVRGKMGVWARRRWCRSITFVGLRFATTKN